MRISDWSSDVCSSDLAADLTRRLLTFARSEPARPEMTDVDACIASFAQLIERTIGDRIALTLDLHTEGLRCWLDRHKFENALLNQIGRATVRARVGQYG